MELALEKRQVKCCTRLMAQRIRCEAMQEMIVPDACEDIALIAGASGDVMVDSRTLTAGKLSIGGRVAVKVLYAGESGALESLMLTIPFRADWENSRIPDSGAVRLRPRLENITVRELNPRKVLVRVNIAADAEIFTCQEKEICVSAGAQEGLYQKKERLDTEVLTSLDEKEITVSDRLELPGAKPPAKSLLRYGVQLLTGDSKAVGGKVIFKGGARIEVCYLSDANTAERASFELPFSQIIDCSCEDAAGCAVNMYLCDMGVELTADREGRSFDVDLTVMVQALCSTRQEIEYLADMYSSRGEVSCESEQIILSCPAENMKKSVTVREVIDTGTPPASVADVNVNLSEPKSGDSGWVCDGEVGVIFIDEKGAASGAGRVVKVPCPAELAEGAAANLAGDVTARSTSGGVEVEFTVEFTCAGSHEAAFTPVTGADIAPAQSGEDFCGAVLCRAEGESLWEICRRYRADPDLTARLNCLQDDRPAADTFLLIPIEG